MSCKRPSSADISRYLSVWSPNCSRYNAISSRNSRMRERNETWACAVFCAAAAACSIFVASASRALDWSRNSFNNCLRVVISPFIACARSRNARYSLSLPDFNAVFICAEILAYSFSRDARAVSCISHAAPICPSPARISSCVAATPAFARCKLFNSLIRATIPCFSPSNSARTAFACSINASCAAPGSTELILAFNSATVFSNSLMTRFWMLMDSTISCVVLSIASPLPTTASEKPWTRRNVSSIAAFIFSLSITDVKDNAPPFTSAIFYNKEFT